MTIDGRAPALAEVDGGGWTASLGFTNLTDQDARLAVQPAATADRGCELTVDKPTLPKAEHTDVKVTIPAGCKVDDKEGIDFTATATAGDSSTPFPITSAPKPAEKPAWTELRAFPIVFLVLLLVGVVAALTIATVGRNKLEYLDASWSFKESWVSNITIGAGLLTGIIGTSAVLKAALGDNAEQAIALGTVAGAIAASLAAAGPLLLLADKASNGGSITSIGLVAAAVLTLTGAFGQIWVVYRAAAELDLGGAQDWLWPGTVLIGALLLWYAVATLYTTIAAGSTAPEPKKKSDTLVAAAWIVRALKAQSKAGLEVEAGERTAATTTAFEDLDAAVAASPPPRRAALL